MRIGIWMKYSRMPNFDMVEKIAVLCEFDVVFIDKNSAETI